MIHDINKGIAILCLCAFMVACGGGTTTSNQNPTSTGTPSVNPDTTTPSTNPPQTSTPVTPPPAVSVVPVPTLSAPLSLVRQRARASESYAIYYGALDALSIQSLQPYPLVIVHPRNGNLTRAQIQAVQQGVNPADPADDVVVMCYISVGEDSRTYNLSNAQMLADPRFVGDGTGPSVDPRGTGLSNRSLVGINPLGTPTNGGFASWYLNDNATYNPASAPAGVPDQNPNFLSRYVNAGDPKWYDVINNELADAAVTPGYPPNPPGLKEMLTTTTGRGLGCDGIFLDTIDTAAPNYFAPSISNFEWTAKGFSNFIKKLRIDYPDKVILQNRGLFYFDPRRPHYEVSARGDIDIFMFESYRLNSDASQTFHPNYFPDNKYNYAPKIMAEANRADGFKVISLGYANGWGAAGLAAKPGIDIASLTGGSTLGFTEFITDIQEAIAVGFRHYLTDAAITVINPFARLYTNLADTTPPQWSSIYNANYGLWPGVATAQTPRVGIQTATVSAGNVTLEWDVALDMNKVGYVLYYQTTPFDFTADSNLSTATRIVLPPIAGNGYSQVWQSNNPNTALQNVYPNQQTILNLPSGATCYFVIRAFDSAGNEEKNQTVVSVAL
jgi:hypothetical protein